MLFHWSDLVVFKSCSRQPAFSCMNHKVQCAGGKQAHVDIKGIFRWKRERPVSSFRSVLAFVFIYIGVFFRFQIIWISYFHLVSPMQSLRFWMTLVRMQLLLSVLVVELLRSRPILSSLSVCPPNRYSFECYGVDAYAGNDFVTVSSNIQKPLQVCRS